MFRLTLLSLSVLILACSREAPPTGPAGKITGDDCALCGFLESQNPTPPSTPTTQPTEESGSPALDRQALFNVYEVLAGAAGQEIHFLKDGLWASRSTVAKWYGVTVEQGRVVELSFEWTKSRKIAFHKPVFHELVQALSPLTELRRVYIQFQSDDITTSPEKWNRHHQAARDRTWPAEIAKLSKLEYISLHGQPLNLTGPATQLNLKQATVYLPVDDSFWNMTGLEELEVFSSRIARVTEQTVSDELLTWGWDSQIAVPEEIGQLRNLKKLRIGGGYKEVVVSLPETIAQLTELEELSIGPSTIQLPASLSALTNLQYLLITGHGQLPASWGQMASLKTLGINSPQVHMQFQYYKDRDIYDEAGLTEYDGYIHGPLPAEWGDLSNLESLGIGVGEAGYLNGELPAEWSRLSKLKGISFPNHEFEGHLPAEWGQLTQLKYLNLSNNLLEGTIPPEWCQITSLEKLLLSGNALSGTIPSQISDLTNLKSLGLSGNQLTGELVNFSNMRSLESIGLADNQLSGKINGRYFPVSIMYIGLSGNNFDKSGEFPDLTHLSNLRSFSEISSWPGPISYTDICPKLPQAFKESSSNPWACGPIGYVYSEGSS